MAILMPFFAIPRVQGCVQFRVESTLAHSTQFSFELTFELIFECATLWMPIHWAEWGFIGLVRTIPFNSHSRIDSLLSKSSHGWECECARMAFELDTTLLSIKQGFTQHKDCVIAKVLSALARPSFSWKKITFSITLHISVDVIVVGRMDSKDSTQKQSSR